MTSIFRPSETTEFFKLLGAHQVGNRCGGTARKFDSSNTPSTTPQSDPPISVVVHAHLDGTTDTTSTALNRMTAATVDSSQVIRVSPIKIFQPKDLNDGGLRLYLT